MMSSELDRLGRLTEEFLGHVRHRVELVGKLAAQVSSLAPRGNQLDSSPEEDAAEHIAMCRRQGMTPARVIACLHSLQASVGQPQRRPLGWMPTPTWDDALVAIARAARELRQPR